MIRIKFKQFLLRLFSGKTKAQNPAPAYDLISKTYDDDPDNIAIALDQRIFPALLNDVSLEGKIVVDVGCGTGRYWPLLLSLHPRRLSGFDVSAGMLDQLKEKFADAEVHTISDHRLLNVAPGSVDVIVSTLTLHYVTSLEETFSEWDRVLRPGGNVIFTADHPEALRQSGGAIHFRAGSENIAISHNNFSIDEVRELAENQGWIMANFRESSGSLIYGFHFFKGTEQPA